MQRGKMLAWAGFALTALISALAIALIFAPASRQTFDPAEVLSEMSWVVDAVTIALAGAVLGARLTRNPLGWLLLAAGLALAAQSVFDTYTLLAFWTGSEGLWGGLAAAWFDQWIWFIPTLSVVQLLHLFPTGTFPSPRWRAIGIATVVGFVVLACTFAFSAQLRVMTQQGPLIIVNPLGLFTLPDWAYPLLFPPFVISMFLALGSMVVRFLRARGVERQQMKWLLYAAALFIATLAFSYYVNTPIYQALVNLAALGLPLAISVAVVRYRLYDIDVIIRKTLVYATLTALLALVYFGSVILLQRLLGALLGIEQSPLAVVVSTLAIVVLFTPLRRRVQDWIDRRFYRQKYDAQQVLARFALTARDETDLDALTGELAQVVQETMQPERVSLWLRND